MLKNLNDIVSFGSLLWVTTASIDLRGSTMLFNIYYKLPVPWDLPAPATTQQRKYPSPELTKVTPPSR